MDSNRPNQMNNAPIAPMSSPVTPMGTPVRDNGHKKVGPIIATLVIVLVLIIAALYLFASRINKEPVPTDTSAAMTTNDTNNEPAAPTVAPVTGTSDDPASIQADLNASTNNLDQQNF